MTVANYDKCLAITFPLSPSYGITVDGRVQRFDTGRWLKPGLASNGYFTVNLWEDGKGRTWTIHWMLAYVFIGPPPTPDHEVAHADGDKLNNALSNLRWATRTENNSDKIKHGRHRRPDCQKLSDRQVREIVTRRKTGEGAIKLAREFGVSQALISGICLQTHRQWAFVE